MQETSLGPDMAAGGQQAVEAARCPWLTFKVFKNVYAVNSEYVSNIMILPDRVEETPEAPPYLRGIYTLRGRVLPLIELRSMFGHTSLQQEYQEFTGMLEARKQDHLYWARELQRCAETGDTFTLATDPHKCAFGQWYDHFTSEFHSVNFHMKKLDEPHKKLHAAALDVMKCTQQCDTCQRQECLKSILARVTGEYVPRVVSLLDEAKEVFRNSFREMVVVLEMAGLQIGAIVDEVRSVEQLTREDAEGNLPKFCDTRFVSGICKSQAAEGTILQLNERALFHSLGPVHDML